MSGIIAQNTLDNSGLIKAPAGGGAWNFIKKLTASSSATLDFVDGTSDVVLDSTYKEYVFTFKNMHPQTDSVDFEFQGSTDGGSNYNTTMTTTTFRATAKETDAGDVALGYRASEDQAQGTSFQDLNIGMGNDNDQSLNGTLHLFNPSSDVFVKHFIARIASPKANDYHVDWFCAGYFNTTSAIDAMQFKMSSGNIDAGDICLYGITT